MHKCTNNSVGNVYQLEQLVDNFFPYSQKQLGFDKPVSIVFQSDEDNSSKMLGKTAYYNPEGFEIVLYTDGRHPKDVMRSLSHELVHHAQNCRGDFSQGTDLPTGYAQDDPHMRKMEREAYTKGNLIFRDFEDLIKTGKINIEIDFSDSGEPKMSLKEWKNNEINTKLMKKWGLLKETIKTADDEIVGEAADDELEEGCGDAYRSEDEEELEENAEWAGTRRRDDPITALTDKDYEGIGSEESDDEEGNRPSMAADMDIQGGRVTEPASSRLGKRRRTRGALGSGVWGENATGKISVREAKEITRRIIERIKKENN